MFENKNRKIEEIPIHLSEESILALLKGEDVHVAIRVRGNLTKIVVSGKRNGMFLTYDQIHELEVRSQMSVFAVLEELKRNKEE